MHEPSWSTPHPTPEGTHQSGRVESSELASDEKPAGRITPGAPDDRQGEGVEKIEREACWMSEKLRGVHPREGGPYSLYCYDCVTWVPNTANSEMLKEGCFSHSHFYKPKEQNRNLQAGLTEGTICQQINSGIFLACFNQDYHNGVVYSAIRGGQDGQEGLRDRTQ